MWMMYHKQNERSYVTYCCPEMEDLANALVARDSTRFEKQNINWKQFQDGEPNLFINNLERCKRRDVLFLASWSSLKQKYLQYAVLCVLASKSFAHSFTIVLPYFPAATMERVDLKGTVATAAIDARLLSHLPYMRWPIELIIYDLHTLQNEFYFHRACSPVLCSAIPLFKKTLNKLIKRPCIVFPDNGAAKRFGSFFPEQDYDIVICGKVRKRDKRIVHIHDGNPYKKEVVIVDDLVKTGGTLIECRHALMEAGALGVSCYVTHAVFPKDAYKRFMTKDLFQYVWTTDTIPTMAKTLKQVGPPFQIIPIVTHLFGQL